MKRKTSSPADPHKPCYSSQERAQILEQYERSQLSVSEFTAQHGMKPSTLYSWRHRHRELVTQAALVVAEPKPAFQEVALPEIFRANGSWAGELELPNGTQLRWNPQASLVVLQSLLTQLRRPC